MSGNTHAKRFTVNMSEPVSDTEHQLLLSGPGVDGYGAPVSDRGRHGGTAQVTGMTGYGATGSTTVVDEGASDASGHDSTGPRNGLTPEGTLLNPFLGNGDSINGDPLQSMENGHGGVLDPEEAEDKHPSKDELVTGYKSNNMLRRTLRATRDRLKCSKPLAVCSLVSLIISIVLGSFMVSAIAIYSKSDTERHVSIRQGDTVLLDTRGGFLYKSLTFAVDDSAEDEYELFVYGKRCDQLKVRTQKDVYNSPTLTGITDPLALLGDRYLLFDSHLSLNLTSNASHHSSQGKVCIFDHLDWFQQFLGGEGLEHYIKCFVISLGVGNNHSNTEIEYTFTENSYYYIGFTVADSDPDPVDIQYNFTLLVNSYNHSDYTNEQCRSIANDDGCTVDLKPDWTNSDEEHCILGFTPIPPVAELRYVDVKENMDRRFFTILVLLFVVLLGMVIVTTLVPSCLC